MFFEGFFFCFGWWRDNGEFRGFFLSVLNSEKPVRLSSSHLPERINDSEGTQRYLAWRYQFEDYQCISDI